MKEVDAIKALTFGLLDGGGEIFTNFPGYMSHKLFSSLGGKDTSVNEKTAYEITWGSSFAGKRSTVMFKNVGLNDAADPFLNSILLGINAGLVVIVFDDVFIEGSQSRQDSRHYFDFFGGLWFEPYSIQNAYDVSYKAFSLSEKFQIPVVIRITSQFINLTGSCLRKKKQKKTALPVCDHKRFVVHPVNSKYQRQNLIRKNIKIEKFIDNMFKNSQIKTECNRKKQLLLFGCCANEEEKYVNDGFTKTQFFTYPIPQFVNELVQNSAEAIILEQGDDFAFRKISEKKLLNSQIKSDTGFIPDKSRGYIISANYEGLFSATKEIKIPLLIGDLGEYTKDTLDSVDAVLCFGSSISVGIGCLLAGQKNVFSIIGDGAYLHSGKNSIIEAIKRDLPVKIIVICNGGSQGTGGQIIPGDLYYQPKQVNVYKIDYKKSDKSDFKRALKKMMLLNSVSILYVQM